MPNADDQLPFTAVERERYFEDYVADAVHVLGEVEIDEDRMIAFARDFDSQDIHIDREKAAAGPFGGLIASGWYTGSLMMRFYARHYLSDASSLASPGMERLRWLAPVRAGDVLTVRVAIKETRRSESKPGRGIVKTLIEVLNQDGTVVMDIDAVNFILCRSAE